MIERIEKHQYEAIDHRYRQHEEIIQLKHDRLKELHDSVARKLGSYSKQHFLLEEENLSREASQINIEDVDEGAEFEAGCIPSQLVPGYDKRSFRISNYSEARRRKEVLYTDIFHSRGLDWRLKIYPNGNDTSEDIYISIFVELHRVAACLS